MADVVASVVTVVRNDLTGLQRTWGSLLTQSRADWEWIVVDGDSTDGTAAWLESLDDVRVRSTSEPDDGLYPAMEKGLNRASGALVTFLNGGDGFADDGVVAAVVESHDSAKWLWAYGRLELVAPAGSPAGVLVAEPFSAWQLRWGRRTAPHPASWFETSFARSLGGYPPDFEVAADQVFMLRASERAVPHLLRRVLTRFELGGLSGRSRPDEWVWAARRLRRLDGVKVWWDLPLTLAFSGERKLRARLAARRLSRSIAAQRPPSEPTQRR